MIKYIKAASLALALVAGPAIAGDTPAPEGAEVYFANLEDGATVSAPVTVVFGLRGYGSGSGRDR